MQPFAFESVLFDHRAEATDALSRAGYQWLAHFSTIDLMHDVFGIEVCGIAEENDARCIECVLRRTFPSWKHYYIWLPTPEHGHLDIGWIAVIHRDPPRGS